MQELLSNNYMGIIYLIGFLFQFITSLFLVIKDKPTNITGSFSAFFMLLSLSFLLMSFYTLMPGLELTSLFFIYLFIFIFSSLGSYFIIYSIYSLILPRTKTNVTPIFGVMVVLQLIALILIVNNGIIHNISTRVSVKSELFSFLLLVTQILPILYCYYILKTPSSYSSPLRQKWINNIKKAFTIYLIFPIVAVISSFTITLGEVGPISLSFIKLFYIIVILAPLIIIYSLPNFEEWNFDQLSTDLLVKLDKEGKIHSVNDYWAKF